MNEKDFLQIAQIGKSVGLKGELKLHLHCDFPEQFKKGTSFYISKKDSIEIENYSKNRSVVKFKGIDTIDDAKRLTNKFLYTSKDLSIKNCHLQNGEFFWFDVIGAEVYDRGKFLGKVENIERFEPNDYLVIKTDNALLKDKIPKTFLIPYIDRYIINFDKENNKIETVDTLEILQNS